MDSKNEFDKLREFFSDEKTNLPDEFTWETMEDGIIDKMNMDKKPKRRVFIIIFFLFTAAFIVLGIRLTDIGQDNIIHDIQNQPDSDQKLDKATQSPASPSYVSTPDASASKMKLQQGRNPGSQIQEGSSISKDQNMSEIKDNVPLVLSSKSKNTTGQLYIKEENKTEYKKKTDVISENNSHEFSDLIKNKLPDYASSEINDLHEEIIASGFDKSGINPLNRDEVVILSLPSANSKALQSLKNDTQVILTQPLFANQKPSKVTENFISVFGGISQWDIHYGSVVPERQPYEKTILSYHAQANYTHKFSNHLTIMAGLGFHKLETRLDYSLFIKNYTTQTLYDTILTYNTNSITGEKSQIRGDVEVNVNATRRVRHYNQYQLIQIPFAVGRSWSISQKIFAEVSLGGAVNILAFNKGRSVDQGRIIDFNHSSTPFLDNRWGFHAMGSVKLRYKIHEHVGILLDVGLQKSLSNWSTETNVLMRPMMRHIGLGIFYAL
jgi:hypothetical protein